jgi:hypothetical protein
VTGHLFFRMLGLPATSLKIDMQDAHPFCNSCSASTSACDAKKRVVDHAITRSVSAVHRLSSDTSLSVRDSLQVRRARWAVKEAKMAKVKTADSKGRLKIRTVHPGSFSARTARSPKRV